MVTCSMDSCGTNLSDASGAHQHTSMDTSDQTIAVAAAADVAIDAVAVWCCYNASLPALKKGLENVMY